MQTPRRRHDVAAVGVAELTIDRRRTRVANREILRRNQDANVIRHDAGRDKVAIVESAVIAFPRANDEGRRTARPRSRKSWCLHKILISDTSQSGISDKGGYEGGGSARLRDIRAPLYLSLFYFVCVGFSHEGSARPTAVLAVLPAVHETLFDK